MTLPSLIIECEAQGIHLTANSGGGLDVDGPDEAMTPSLLERLKALKGELLDIIEIIDERSAIMEYDGCVTREKAENAARQFLTGNKS